MMDRQNAQNTIDVQLPSDETYPRQGYSEPMPGQINTRSANNRRSTRHMSAAPTGTVNTATVKRLYPLEE